MTAAGWHLSFGANLIDRDRTRFRLWAPAQSAVAIAIEDRATEPMTRNAEGWFEAEMNCGAGTRYRYILQDGTAVPDPASRAQSGDIHGFSVVVDPSHYRWRHRQWQGRPWTEAIIYELHAGLLGGYAGVARELPRLAALGITAIELMPIAEFPGSRNWGYDGALPFAPECSYGTSEDLKALVDAAHDHEISIFLDVVYNHFGPDGNYLSLYAPQFFRDDVATPWGPAIDFRRREVRRFFTDNALYWLNEFRFDGLRFDAVHAITETDWLEEMAAAVRKSVAPGRQVHLVLENDNNDASLLDGPFDAQWNDDGHHVLHVLLTGEHDGYYEDYESDPALRLARGLKDGFVYQGEASKHRGGKPRGTPSGNLPPTAFVLFLQNHDQIGNRAFGERLTVLADPRALEAAIALQLLCPQIPLLFMGEETASVSPFLFFTDHNAELAKAVREGRRREFMGFSQFSDPALLAKLADPNEVSTFDRSKPEPDADRGPRREELYRKLIGIRRSEIVPRLAGARAVNARAVGDKAVVAHWRMGDNALLTIGTNLGADSVAMPMHQGRIIFASSPAAAESCHAGRLEPYATVAVLAA
ncbi:MAG TPA: malto-oligosyltrehalose trehalohydrolase [Xanthobacteraceae bacterium]|jgi:malto-oligosyltrehalose trehalohydrolase|nr:malto-oligosyltrehalose trehalohydrolase [Xanthobacteraceae bacterium]